MRIVYLHQYFRTPQQSGSTRSYEMAKVLVAQGHKVTMVTADEVAVGKRVRHATIDGIDVHYLPVRYDNSMSYVRRLLAFSMFACRSIWWASRSRCDVIFATSTPLTIAVPGMLASRIRRVPFVFEVRDMWPDVPIAMGVLQNPLLRRGALLLERVAYASSRRIVALAPGMKAEIVAKGVPASKVTVIPNGCDNSLFGSLTAPSPIVDNIGSRRIILFAGTLGAANGVGHLVGLAVELARLAPDVCFVVLGDGAQRASIEAAAERTGVLGTSFFMLGALPKVEVASWLHRADLSMCLFDGPQVLYRNAVQNKFFDSLSAGVPVACNFLGWQTQIAIEGHVGFFLPLDQPEVAASQLLAHLDNASWMATARVTCRELAAERFDRHALALVLEDVLRSGIHNLPAPADRV